MVQLAKISNNYLHLQPTDAEETNAHISSHMRITNGLQKIKKPVTKKDTLFPSVQKKSPISKKTTKQFRPPWVSSTNNSSLSIPRINERLTINPGLQNAGQKSRRKSHRLVDAENDKIQIKAEQVAKNLLPRFRSLPHRRLGKVQHKYTKATKITGLNQTETSSSEQENAQITRTISSGGLLKGVNRTASDFFAPSHVSPKQSETVLESHPLPILRDNLVLENTEHATVEPIAPAALQINSESTQHIPQRENLAVILSRNSAAQHGKNGTKTHKLDSKKPATLQFDTGAESRRPLVFELSTYYTESHSVLPQSVAYPIIKNMQTSVLELGKSPLHFRQSKSIETDINTGLSSGLRHFADLHFSKKIHSPNTNSSSTIGSPSLMHDEVTTVDCYGEKGLLAVDSFNKFLKLNGLLRPWYDFATQISTKLGIATKSTSAEAQANSAATQADHYIPLSNTTTTHEVQVNTRKRTRQAYRGVKKDSSVNTERKSLRLPKKAEHQFVPETTDTVALKTSDGRSGDMTQNLGHSHDESSLEGQSFVSTRQNKKKGRRNKGISKSLQQKPKVVGELETNKLNKIEEASGIQNSVVLTKSLRKVPAKLNTRNKPTKDAVDTSEPKLSICTNKSKTLAMIGLPILLPEPVALLDVHVDSEKSKDDIIPEILHPADANVVSKSEGKPVDVATTEVPPTIPKPTKSSTTKLCDIITRSRTKSSISQRQRHLKSRKLKELGPVKSEIERREQISAKISSMLQDKEIVVAQPRHKSVPTGEARRLNNNFIREKIMHQESDVHRKLRSSMELQAQHTETIQRHQEDLSWTTRPVTPAPLPRRSMPSLQTSVQEEFEKMLKLQSPVIWTFGYTQLSIAKNIQQTLSKLEDIFQLHEINLDIEVTRWATSPKLKKLSKLAMEPPSFPDAVTYHAGKVLHAVKLREGNLKNFSSKEICELLKLALIHAQAIYSPRGYVILNFPITLEEGDDFESIFYPCASGLYFLNNQWSRDKSTFPHVHSPMYVTRAQAYNEANLESIAERYGERTIKISNMDDLSPTKLERIVFALKHNLDSYIQNISGPTYNVASSKDLDTTSKPADVSLLATPPKSSKNSKAGFSKSKSKTYNKTRKKRSVQQQEITLKNVAQ